MDSKASGLAAKTPHWLGVSLNPALRKSALGFLTQVGGKALAFLTVMLMTRLLTPQDYGVFAYLRSWVLFLAPIATLGIGYASYRFLPQYLAARDHRAATGYLLSGHGLTLAAALVFVCAAALCRDALIDHLPAGARGVMLLMALALPACALMQIDRFMVQNLGQVGLSFLPYNVLAPGLQILGLGLTAWTFGVDLLAAANIFLAAHLLALLAALGLVYRLWRRKIGFPRPSLAVPHWLSVSLPLTASAIAMVINQQSGILVVGSMLPAENAAFYNIAMSVTLLISMVAMSVSAVFVPDISRAVGNGDWARVQDLSRSSSLFFFIPALMGFLALLIAGKPVLGLFGQEYIAAHPVLLLLSGGELLIAAGEPAGHILNVSGAQKRNTLISILGAAINVGLSILLTPLWGIEGAAFATLIAALSWTSLRVIEVRRRHGVWPGVYALLHAALGKCSAR